MGIDEIQSARQPVLLPLSPLHRQQQSEVHRQGTKRGQGNERGKAWERHVYSASLNSVRSFDGWPQGFDGRLQQTPPEIGQQWLGAEEGFWVVAMLRAGEFLRGLEYDRSALAGRSKDSLHFAEVCKSVPARQSLRR